MLRSLLEMDLRASVGFACFENVIWTHLFRKILLLNALLAMAMRVRLISSQT